MTKETIIDRLNAITSYYSFGRILGYIAFNEGIGIKAQLENGQKKNNERLITAEIRFLAGLWVQNVDTTKSLDITHDEKIIAEVYNLMDKLHNIYVESGDIKDGFIENFFYEGDFAYDWQYTTFAKEKYQHTKLSSVLKFDYAYDIFKVKSTISKIKKIIIDQLKYRIERKRKTKEYISPVNAFTIKYNKYNKVFDDAEKKIIRRFTIKIGDRFPSKIFSIDDYNYFRDTPIIEIPNRGFFVVDVSSIAIASDELPDKWLLESDIEQYNQIKGQINEDIVLKILKRRFENCFKSLDILRYKKKGKVSDIDDFFSFENFGCVFQVKSKCLTNLSHQGNLEKIREDTKMAIIDAYNQGIACIDCLKDPSKYYSLVNSGLQYTEKLELIYISITRNAFPGISTLCSINNVNNSHEMPIIAMSIYDLDTIFYLFQPSDIVEYLKFRVQCAKKNIFGVNEIYYIGAFMANKNEGIKLTHNRIPREYALFADYIIKQCKNNQYKNKDVDCDIPCLIAKFPITSPITCQ